MIKYLGSKRLLTPLITEVVSRLAPTGTVLDLFSGTSRVGHALKRRGYRVVSNDHNAYAAALGRCYVQADLEDHARAARQLVRELDALPGSPGYFTRTFCERSRFFHPSNGARVDAIRAEIARKGLEPELEAVLLVSLMEAADRVDSTTGVQMAYLKRWAPRALAPLALRVPELLPRAAAGKGAALQLDALEAAGAVEADVAYVDPPYNQHKYLGNYHVWETLVLGDEPEVYGVACKRVDCRTRRSAFNSRREASGALAALVGRVRAPCLVVSFSDEGYLGRAELERLLAARGHVAVLERDFKRYVGAQIGIHDPKGVRVGEVSHLRNTERLYVVAEDPRRVERVGALAHPAPPPAPAPRARRAAGAPRRA